MTNTNIYTRLNNLVCALRADEDNRESYYSFAKKVAEAAELGEFQEW